MVPPIKKQQQRKNKKFKRPDPTRRSVEQFAGDAYSLAQRSIAGLNQIRKYINIEEKFLDVSSSLSPDQNGSLAALTQLAQGTTMNTRVGNSIRVQRLSIMGRVAVNSSVTSFSMVRVLVFRDMEGQGTAPAMSDVLESVGSTSAPRQPYDWLNRKRFSIVADWYFPVTVNSGGSTSVREFTLDEPFTKHVLYRGTSAAAASDGEGTIYIGAVSDEATNTPTVAFTSRITYTDD